MSDLLGDAEPFDVLLEEVLRDPRATFAARPQRGRLWRRIAIAAVALLGVGAVVGVALLRPTRSESPRFAVPPQGKDAVVPQSHEEFMRLLAGARSITFIHKEAIGAIRKDPSRDTLWTVDWPDQVVVNGEALAEWRTAFAASTERSDWKGMADTFTAKIELADGKHIEAFVGLGPDPRFDFGGSPPLLPAEDLFARLRAVNDELQLRHRRALGQALSAAELAQLPATCERVDCPAFAGLAQQLSRFTALKELRLRATGNGAVLVDDAYLAQLAGLPLTALDLPAAALTDTGFAQLASLPQLTSLVVRDADYEFTGSGFAALTKLPLRELTLHESHGIHAVGYAALTKLPRLATLRLSRSGLRADGTFYPTLQSFPSLTELVLRGENIRDTDMPHLLRTRLRKLVLVSADVTGAGLETLKDLPSLRELQLVGVKLQESDIEHLGRLTSLQRLEIDNDSSGLGLLSGNVTGILTANAAKLLVAALPKCTVVYDPTARWFNWRMALPMLRD